MLLDIIRGDGVADEVRVAPSILSTAAGDCGRLRDEIGEAVTNGPPRGPLMRDVVQATQQAADRLDGWLTQRALRDLLQKQGDDLSRLSRRLTAIAAALEASALAYSRNESANAALFKPAEGPW
ncbi:MAG TPA: hypothetical protein VFC19_30375 [Candidatus Limnocylindrales bacterium]|nr:hypothetical protein [Candidatus Limnocylindrales bacterium]